MTTYKTISDLRLNSNPCPHSYLLTLILTAIYSKHSVSSGQSMHIFLHDLESSFLHDFT